MMRAIVIALILCSTTTARAEEQIDFNRDVRPILSNNCFRCHGPDEGERQGSGEGLRLDIEAEAKRALEGTAAIVPSEPGKSELVRRIQSTDEAEIMPPRDSGKHLTPAQIDTLIRWVEHGAPYAEHWAWKKPQQAELPKVTNQAWSKSPIDRFVLAKLEQQGLAPSPAADRYTLVRRVYLDLIGLPPTPAEADAFIADDSPNAYAKLVDRLLESPAYGERWARRWLDLARYADTNGYEKDRPRSIWPYRDWVIRALNADMPFDQFTVRQLAGDMLPAATQDDLVATGFHRNTMLNEEGGVDPLEFRFYALVDRVSTTGATWLGLTTGCAQCHTHKFDPLTHREYYGLMALLNNASEPEYELETPEIKTTRATIEAKIAALQADLPNRFTGDEITWSRPHLQVVTASQTSVEETADNVWRIAGENPETNTYTITFDSAIDGVDCLRLETFVDGDAGPGRTPHGNFVLSEISVALAAAAKIGDLEPLKIARATADFSQTMFPVEHAVDGDLKTGWAVDGEGRKDRAATFYLAKPINAPAGSKLIVKLVQQFGGKHTIGKFAIKTGQSAASGSDCPKSAAFDQAFSVWQAREAKNAVEWTSIRPASASSNLPILTVQDDNSVFSSGDVSKSDTYEIKFRTSQKNFTAIRLEGLPDARLPRGGPGRVYYEGAPGDFGLSNFTMDVDGAPVKFKGATQSFAEGGHMAKNALDDNLQTIWGVNGAQGKEVQAIFELAEPLAATGEVTIRMLFERHYSAAIGRFRISVTNDPRPQRSVMLPADVCQALIVPTAQRTAEQSNRLRALFASQASQLSAARKEIEQLRASLPKGSSTLVMREWPAGEVRPTPRYHRGEFLQPRELVTADVPHFLPPLTDDVKHDRLAFAKWLVARDNPLTARVTVNRQWQAFFGRGLVRTLEDFGFQGEPASHPALLDYLAVEFMDDSWSLKRLHKRIVMSATYQQSSDLTPELLERDPNNILLARGPRFRLEAEVVRDSALKAAGLLSAKMLGPSVFPPQPASVTTDGAYGQLAWNTSQGEDRFRRSLYTFAKRTQPFALLSTFDGPTGEACVARRETSNTPLQGLTLLNDTVFFEAHQALGDRIAALTCSTDEKLLAVFRECLTRTPTDDELKTLRTFVADLQAKFASGKLDAAKIASAASGDVRERALWTLVARALLNTDEAVTKN